MLKHLCHFTWHRYFQHIRIIDSIQILTSLLLKHNLSLKTPEAEADLAAEIVSVLCGVDFHVESAVKSKSVLINIQFWSKFSTYNKSYLLNKFLTIWVINMFAAVVEAQIIAKCMWLIMLGVSVK